MFVSKILYVRGRFQNNTRERERKELYNNVGYVLGRLITANSIRRKLAKVHVTRMFPFLFFFLRREMLSFSFPADFNGRRDDDRRWTQHGSVDGYIYIEVKKKKKNTYRNFAKNIRYRFDGCHHRYFTTTVMCRLPISLRPKSIFRVNDGGWMRDPYMSLVQAYRAYILWKRPFIEFFFTNKKTVFEIQKMYKLYISEWSKCYDEKNKKNCLYIQRGSLEWLYEIFRSDGLRLKLGTKFFSGKILVTYI